MQYFEGEVWKSIISFSAQQHAEWCIDALLNRIESSNEKYDVFAEIIRKADLKTLSSMAYYIYRIECGYGRLSEKSQDERIQIISIEQLEQLEGIYSERVAYLVNNEQSLFECNSILFVIYLWKSFDDNTCVNYMNELLKEPINILRFIVRMSYKRNSTDGQGWGFSDEIYLEFISKDKIVDAIDRYFKGKIVGEFSEEEEIKMASFIMLNIDEYHHYVSEKQALKYLKQFKHTNESM